MSILNKLINFCSAYLRSLYDDPDPFIPYSYELVPKLCPASDLIRRMEIGEEITALRNQIVKRRKQKKEFRSLKPRLNALMAELLEMDIAK
jgi:hypothetical protein